MLTNEKAIRWSLTLGIITYMRERESEQFEYLLLETNMSEVEKGHLNVLIGQFGAC